LLFLALSGKNAIITAPSGFRIPFPLTEVFDAKDRVGDQIRRL